MPATKIAVIGAGVIGRTLATRWRQAGHTVAFGVRNPQDPGLRAFAQGIGAGAAAIGEAGAAADVVLLAVNGAAMGDVVTTHGAALAGRTVIDAANNLTGTGPLNSLALLDEHAPGARVYRAFNSLGVENFADADFGGTSGDLLYTGPAGPSQAVVETLVGDTGLRPVRVGDNDKAGIVDDLARLWFALAFEQGLGRNLGFKILTR